jgi:hypothetical protein
LLEKKSSLNKAMDSAVEDGTEFDRRPARVVDRPRGEDEPYHPPAKRGGGVGARLTRVCANHPTACLVVIVILVAVVVYVCYFRGGLGGLRKRRAAARDKPADAGDGRGDAETERLIAKINSGN